MVSEAKRNANNRYDERTYKRITIHLRLEDDASIIKDLAEAQEHGISYRDWLRQLYEDAKQNK